MTDRAARGGGGRRLASTARRGPPAAAGGLVVNELGDVLLVNQCGTSWSFPKGHVEDGETRLETAHREIYEETGLAGLHPASELTTYERSAITAAGTFDESRQKQITLYLFRASGSASPTPRDPDNPEARWFPRAIAELMLTHPRDRLELRRLRKHLPPASDSSAEEYAARCLRSIAPECPAHVVDRFVRSLEAESELLASQAELTLDKPYGVNHILIAEGEAGLSFARLMPDTTSSHHVHARRSELFWVRRGELTLRSGEDELKLQRGEIGVSVPGRPHAIANEGPELVEIVEVFVPALLSDKVRLSDRYARPLGPVDVGQ